MCISNLVLESGASNRLGSAYFHDETLFCIVIVYEYALPNSSLKTKDKSITTSIVNQRLIGVCNQNSWFIQEYLIAHFPNLRGKNKTLSNLLNCMIISCLFSPNWKAVATVNTAIFSHSSRENDTRSSHTRIFSWERDIHTYWFLYFFENQNLFTTKCSQLIITIMQIVSEFIQNYYL